MNSKEEDIKSASEELLAQVKEENESFAGGEPLLLLAPRCLLKFCLV